MALVFSNPFYIKERRREGGERGGGIGKSKSWGVNAFYPRFLYWVMIRAYILLWVFFYYLQASFCVGQGIRSWKDCPGPLCPSVSWLLSYILSDLHNLPTSIPCRSCQFLQLTDLPLSSDPSVRPPNVSLYLHWIVEEWRNARNKKTHQI